MFKGILILLTVLSVLIPRQFMGQRLRMIADHCNFYHPETGHFTEIYLQFLAGSVHYSDSSKSPRYGEIDVQLILSREDKIAAFDKFRVRTEPNAEEGFEDFYSVKRFPTQPGNYVLELVVVDRFNAKDTIAHSREITVQELDGDMSFSDIELVESMRKTTQPGSFTKNGMEIIPRLSSYFPVDADKLIFYSELYNTHLLGDTGKLALRYSINDARTGKPVGEYMGIKRLKPAQVIPLAYSFAIAQLGSGEYVLSLDLLNEDGQLLRHNRLRFDRFNPIVTDLYADTEETVLDPFFKKELRGDSILYFLESLIPIAGRIEQANILKVLERNDSVVAQKYFQGFWKKTDGTNPTEAWLKYKKAVLSAQRDYGSAIIPGFRSDRGRIFLTYGPPDAVVSRPNDPGEYPYEIWQYYKIEQFSNKRFIFYNPMVVGNDYQLLHSDIPGELSNTRWRQELTRGSTPSSRTRTGDEGIMRNREGWGN
jgi:GWxTD domain-containing protein